MLCQGSYTINQTVKLAAMYAKVIPSKPKSVKQIITINTKVKTLSKVLVIA